MIRPAFFTTSLLAKPEGLLLRNGAYQKQVLLRVRVGYFHHPALGHTLIDTGYSAHVTVPGQTRDGLLSVYRRLIQPNILSPAPLTTGLGRLGVDPDQIDTVIVSHFHADHTAGLADLPQARVICVRAAWRSLQRQSRLKNALHGVFPSILPRDLDQRLRFVDDAPLVPGPLGLGPGWDIAGDGSLLAIDLPGHLQGHIGLCFAQLDPPFLYAVDAQWLLQAITDDRCPGFPARLVHHDAKALQETVAHVRQFARRGGDIALCHEPRPHRYDIDSEVGG